MTTRHCTVHINDLPPIKTYRDIVIVLFSEVGPRGILGGVVHRIGHHQGSKDARDAASGAGRNGLVDSNNLHPVSRLARVPEIVLHDDLHRTGELARGSRLGELLDGDGLLVDEVAHPKLGDERVALLVLGGPDGGRREAIQGSGVPVDARRGESLGGGAVVHGFGNLGADKGAAGDDASDLDQVVEELGGEGAGVDGVGAEFAAEGDVAQLVLDQELQGGGWRSWGEMDQQGGKAADAPCTHTRHLRHTFPSWLRMYSSKASSKAGMQSTGLDSTRRWRSALKSDRSAWIHDLKM
jgi:hypothetical protein